MIIILLDKLNTFYQDEENSQILLSIVNSQNKISLRILDYFVTTYSDKNKVKYAVNDKVFRVYQEYKSQLKAFSKKLFDPFCRGHRITFKFTQNRVLITTIGQLNFFQWAIQNQIVHFVNNNFNKIEMSMGKYNKNLLFKKINKKDNNSSENSSKKLSTYNNSHIDFD